MRSSPHGGCQLQEQLDIILTVAAFEQSVALLFLDDGVFQLKKGQQPGIQALKDTLSIFNALEIYDVNELYFEAESLESRGLKSADLTLPMTECYRKDINQLISQFDVVFSG